MDARGALLAAFTLILYLLHQDYWNWRAAHPLIFGFLPVGLAYHALYTIGAALWMAVLVKLAWPGHLDEPPGQEPRR
jgi:hypothetical protein